MNPEEITQEHIRELRRSDPEKADNLAQQRIRWLLEQRRKAKEEIAKIRRRGYRAKDMLKYFENHEQRKEKMRKAWRRKHGKNRKRGNK